MKLLRESMGLSQNDVAKALNISQQSVYKYEHGICLPNLTTLVEISSFFHTSIDFLLDNSPLSEQELSIITHMKPNTEEYNLIVKYRQLSKPNQDMLKNVLVKLLDEDET
jgi:transcriptional regulator with XRE-family HTH domain